MYIEPLVEISYSLLGSYHCYNFNDKSYQLNYCYMIKDLLYNYSYSSHFSIPAAVNAPLIMFGLLLI